ncbi:MAG: MarR family transcriptional regulator [Pseudonocardia sp.]|nr:MarR family transcriptional regulator [Pseudonocardia sp.]
MDEGPRWLTDDEQAAWLAFRAATTLLDGALDRQLQREAGMPLAYYQILAMLSEVPGRTLRMSELADITQSSQSRISHAVARLERQGWVRRRPCQDDRRSTFAELTPAGMTALAEAAPGHVRTVRQNMFDALSAEQVGQLAAICHAMLGPLTADPAARPVPGALPGRPGPAGCERD